MPENILDQIRKDHVIVREALDSILKENDFEDKKKIYHQTKMQIVLHLHAEEEAIYKRIDRTHRFADDSGHHDIKDYLQKLNLLSLHENEWQNVFEKFMEHINWYCKEEEDKLLQYLKEDCHREELSEILSDYMKLKDSHQRESLS